MKMPNKPKNLNKTLKAKTQTVTLRDIINIYSNTFTETDEDILSPSLVV